MRQDPALYSTTKQEAQHTPMEALPGAITDIFLRLEFFPGTPGVWRSDVSLTQVQLETLLVDWHALLEYLFRKGSHQQFASAIPVYARMYSVAESLVNDKERLWQDLCKGNKTLAADPASHMRSTITKWHTSLNLVFGDHEPFRVTVPDAVLQTYATQESPHGRLPWNDRADDIARMTAERSKTRAYLASNAQSFKRLLSGLAITRDDGTPQKHPLLEGTANDLFQHIFSDSNDHLLPLLDEEVSRVIRESEDPERVIGRVVNSAFQMNVYCERLSSIEEKLNDEVRLLRRQCGADRIFGTTPYDPENVPNHSAKSYLSLVARLYPAEYELCEAHRINPPTSPTNDNSKEQVESKDQVPTTPNHSDGGGGTGSPLPTSTPEKVSSAFSAAFDSNSLESDDGAHRDESVSPEDSTGVTSVGLGKADGLDNPAVVPAP